MCVPYLDWLPSQDEERFGSLRQETSELVDEDVLDLVGLLDLDGYPHGIDTRFDQNSLVFVSGNC